MILGINIARINKKQRTGVEWYAYHLVEEFKKIVPSDVTVRLYSEEPLSDELAKLPNNWESRVLKWPPRKMWTQLRLSIEMLLHPPDVLFVPAHIFPLITSKKTVMTVHDIAAVQFPESYSRFERFYSVWSSKRAAKKLWKVITPTEFTKKEMMRVFKMDKLSNTVVIPHGYDKAYKEVSNEKVQDVKKKHAITKPYLMSIGRLETKKNTVRIIESFSKLKDNGHDLQLVLVGKPGHGFELVEEAINASPYKEDVIEPGWVEEDDIPALYAGAEVFVFPSLSEGFGIPVLEAMACGTPVVTSKGSCLEEVGSDIAEYVDPTSVDDIAEKVEMFLKDKKNRSERITKGLAWVENFSWEKTARMTLDELVGR